MTRLSFDLHDRTLFGELSQESVVPIGLDGVPWAHETEVGQNQISVEFEESETPKILLPWRISEECVLTLPTASVSVHSKQFVLAVEIARGTINRLLNRVSSWEALGFLVSQQLRAKLNKVVHHFCSALMARKQIAEAEHHSRIAVAVSCEAMLEANQAFVEWQRNRLIGSRELIVGTNSIRNREVVAEYARTLTDNATVVSINWRSIQPEIDRFVWDEVDAEIYRTQNPNFAVFVMGPLIKFDSEFVPDWALEADFDFVLERFQSFTRELVERYRHKIGLWWSSSGVNQDRGTAWTSEQRIQLLQAAQRSLTFGSTTLPNFISFIDPFNDRNLRYQSAASLYFADSMVRGNLGVCGVGIEFDFPSSRQGCGPTRDCFQYLDVIGLWAQLSIPIVTLLWNMGSVFPEHDSSAGNRKSSQLRLSLPSQAQHLQAFLSSISSAPAVQAILFVDS